jgi:hypothetical protein
MTTYPKYILKDENHLFIAFAEGCEPEYSGSLLPRHGLAPVCSEEDEDNVIELSKQEFMVLCAKPAKKRENKMFEEELNSIVIDTVIETNMNADAVRGKDRTNKLHQALSSYLNKNSSGNFIHDVKGNDTYLKVSKDGCSREKKRCDLVERSKKIAIMVKMACASIGKNKSNSWFNKLGEAGGLIDANPDWQFISLDVKLTSTPIYTAEKDNNGTVIKTKAAISGFGKESYSTEIQTPRIRDPEHRIGNIIVHIPECSNKIAPDRDSYCEWLIQNRSNITVDLTALKSICALIK